MILIFILTKTTMNEIFQFRHVHVDLTKKFPLWWNLQISLFFNSISRKKFGHAPVPYSKGAPKKWTRNATYLGEGVTVDKFTVPIDGNLVGIWILWSCQSHLIICLDGNDFAFWRSFAVSINKLFLILEIFWYGRCDAVIVTFFFSLGFNPEVNPYSFLDWWRWQINRLMLIYGTLLSDFRKFRMKVFCDSIHVFDGRWRCCKKIKRIFCIQWINN